MPVGLQRKIKLVVSLVAAFIEPRTAFVASRRVVVKRNFMIRKKKLNLMKNRQMEVHQNMLRCFVYVGGEFLS